MIAFRRALLVIAFAATVFFAAAVPTAGNWKLPFVVALVAFGTYFLAPHWLEERRSRDEQLRRQMHSEYREMWFASFDRRRRMQGRS